MHRAPTPTERFAAPVFPRAHCTRREVLELVAAGCGNSQIARRLVLSEKMVRNYVSAILVKLQVHDRVTVGCYWALMLVAFAADVANLWWMAALTAVMVFEKIGPAGQRGVRLTVVC
jgi:DNA-binding CsgD family transcriptional regulator